MVFKLENFKYGLDSRRSELTSVAGTLETLTNAHINQGAEVEKRKAFVDMGAFPANTFGLERAGSMLVTFGSVDYSTVSTGLTAIGVGYVQCQHPSDSAYAMTKLICSCYFGGSVFCVAQFGTEVYIYTVDISGNNNTAQVISSSIAGQVLYTNHATSTVQTNAQVVAQMYSVLNTKVFQNAGIFVENLTSNGFNIYTAYGTTWSPVVSVTSVSGTITTSLLSTSTEPVVGSNGTSGLTLYAGSSGTISSLNVVAGSTTYKMLPTAGVSYATNINVTTANIATAINNQYAAENPQLPGGSASSSTNNLSIATTASLASSYFSFKVTGSLCFENMKYDFSATTGGSLKNIYTTNGVNLLPSTNLKYPAISAPPYYRPANPTATAVNGYFAFTLAYGTYLIVFGANDLKVSCGGVTYAKTDYPQGVVINYTSGNVLFYGVAGGLSLTVAIYLMTDILANTGINLAGANTAPYTPVTAIATAINAKTSSTGFVASNFGSAGTATSQLYISRASLNMNAAAYSGIYFYIDSSQITGGTLAPAGLTAPIAPASYGFGSPVTSVTGRGTTYSVKFSGTWAAGDTYSFQIVTPSNTYDVGIGRLTQLQPTACITLADRVHMIAGSLWLGSENGDITQWEQQAAGAFSIDVSQSFEQSDALVSLASYQGRIALFANYATLIWALNADPNQISLVQALNNTGTFCALGPQSIGDLDVVYPSVTGFRSLRVRDSSLNAMVVDLGSSVDLLVQEDIAAVGLSNLSTACGIVDPSANRYWCYMPGDSIFVLSYFPSAKIYAAWGLYEPCYYAAGVKTAFVPTKFIIFSSQVYLRGAVSTTDHLILYGGTDNNTYDQCVATVATTWLDLGKPGIRKTIESLDYAMTNSWQFFASADYYGVTQNGGQLQAVTNAATNLPSFQLGSFDVSDDGFHVKMQATCNAASYASLSSLFLHYKTNDEK